MTRASTPRYSDINVFLGRYYEFDMEYEPIGHTTFSMTGGAGEPKLKTHYSGGLISARYGHKVDEYHCIMLMDALTIDERPAVGTWLRGCIDLGRQLIDEGAVELKFDHSYLEGLKSRIQTGFTSSCLGSNGRQVGRDWLNFNSINPQALGDIRFLVMHRDNIGPAISRVISKQYDLDG